MISDIRGYIMNEENTGHSVTVDQVIIATVKSSKWWFQLYHQEQLGFVVSLLVETIYPKNINRSSEISDQLRDIFHKSVLLICCYLHMRMFSFSTGLCRQFLGVVKLWIRSNCIHIQSNLSYVTVLWNIEKGPIKHVVAKYRLS